jgi:4-hydroxy-L-threonine phosphate dehydrogenase PdxA
LNSSSGAIVRTRDGAFDAIVTMYHDQGRLPDGARP